MRYYEDVVASNLDTLIDAAFDSGYYAAVLEKMWAMLNEEDRKEYAKLRDHAIEQRGTYKRLLMEDLDITE